MNTATLYLQSVIKRFAGYKELAEKTFIQLEDKDLHYKPNEESNSIAVIIQHMSGNMLSRWTGFLSGDGEKEERDRDAEFTVRSHSRRELLELWEKGWNCMMETLSSLQEDDLTRIIRIRNEPHSVIDAINRQLSHYPYHVGQIVYIGKMILNDHWKSLSIPRGQSEEFNRRMNH